MHFWRENPKQFKHWLPKKYCFDVFGAKIQIFTNYKKDAFLARKIQIFFLSTSLLFLQISQLCNESTHDKVAPTPQNLICDGKSATEIILLSQHNQVSHLTKDELHLTFVQNQEDKNGLILILDLSPAMEPHWSVFRSAIQQLFLTLPDSHFLSAIWNGNYFHR